MRTNGRTMKPLQKTTRGILCSALLLLLAPGILIAQETNRGGIAGTVTDSGGSVVVGAQVSAIEQATSSPYATKTNDSGYYIFSSLPVGKYNVTVTTPGFKAQDHTNIQVLSHKNLTIDVQLAVGQVQETVTVSENDSNPIDTTSVNIEQTRTLEEIQSLPVGIVAGQRSAAAFITTSAGAELAGNVTNVAAQSAWSELSRGGMNGTPGEFFGYQIDGVDAGLGESETGADYTPPVPDVVTQTVVTANTDTTVGFNGGVAYGLTLKSGTNALHGSFYWYQINNDLTAHNWFGSGGSASEDLENELGFTVGGPVVIPHVYHGKNKTFFFVNMDVYRSASQTTQVITTPTLLMRQGNFTEILGAQAGTDLLGRPVLTNEIYDPTTTRTVTAGQIDPVSGLVATGSGPIRDPYKYNGVLNTINPSQFSKVSTYFQNNGFKPPTGSGVFNNFIGRVGGLGYFDHYLIKIDHNISNRQRASFAIESTMPWFLGSANGTTAGPSGASGVVNLNASYNDLVQSGYTQNSGQYRLRANYDFTINPALLFSFAAGTTRTPHANSEPAPTTGAAFTGAKSAGLTGTLSPMTPFISVSGYSANTYGFGPVFGPGEIYNDTRQVFRTSFAWSKSTHLIKWGADYELLPYLYTNNKRTPGSGSFKLADTALPGFTAASTGWGWSSFLIGAVNNFAVTTKIENHFTTGGYAFFGQDTWRATKKLTVNYGLRWEIYMPGHMKYDAISTFDPTIQNPSAGNILGTLNFYGTGTGHNGLHNVSDYYMKAFAPKVGLAYAITPKTVARASFAISYFPMWTKFYGSAGTLVPQTGYQGQSSVNETATSGLQPAFYWDNGFPGVYPTLPNLNPAQLNGSAITWVDHSQNKPPMAENIGFQIEQALPQQWVLNVAYVGNFAHHLPLTGPNLNTLPLADISLGNLLFASVSSPQAVAAGIKSPYAGFSGTVAQALAAYPQFASVSKLSDQWGNNSYNALQMNIQRHFGNLTLLGNYTISKWFSQGTYNGYQGQGTGNSYQHPALRAKEAKQLNPLDEPQVMNLSYVYILPFGKGKQFLENLNRFEDSVVGGWRVSGIQSYTRGQPMSVTGTASIPGVGGVWVNSVPGVPVTLTSWKNLNPHSSNNRILNPAAFSEPAPFTFGNTYQIKPRLQGYKNETLSFDKSIPLYREANFHFGLLFLNAFNRHLWGTPDTGIADPGFGTVSSVSTPRQIQFYGRFEF